MTPAKTICLGFLAVILLGTFFLSLPIATVEGSWSSPVTALFTSTSAVCVTGLSVVDVGSFYSLFGQGIILLLCQVGGLGYMTVTTFLLQLIGRRFSLREKLTLHQALDTPGLRGGVLLVQSIVATTLLWEITGIFALTYEFQHQYDLGKSLWLATFHSISAFNNAGFSLFSDSLIGYRNSVVINLVIPLLIIMGGIGYQVILEGFLWLQGKITRSKERIVLSLNFRVATSTTIALLCVGTILFWIIEFSSDRVFASQSWGEELMAAWFQSVTTRTAGFNTVDVGKLSMAGLFITIALMFIGASPGGTGGGIKTTTGRILFNCTNAALRGEDRVHLYNRQIPNLLILKAVGVTVGSVFTVIVATLALSMTDSRFTFAQILFECTSAFGTVGLSTGITPQISPAGQLVLIVTMYIGRVGILLLMAALMRRSQPSMVNYPEEPLLVG